MRAMIHKTIMTTALGTLLAGVSMAQAAPVLPPVHTSGDVQYLSGGIGKGEAHAIERASKHWPLMLEFAVKDRKRADFTADVKVVVHGSKGQAVLDTTAGGPLLLAKLAPGHYDVDATVAGKTLHESVLVKHGQPAKAVFVWPAGTGESRS